MSWKEKFRNLGTFVAFTIQGTYRDKDLTSPMPEPTQQVDWDSEKLAELATKKQKD